MSLQTSSIKIIFIIFWEYPNMILNILKVSMNNEYTFSQHSENIPTWEYWKFFVYIIPRTLQIILFFKRKWWNEDESHVNNQNFRYWADNNPNWDIYFHEIFHNLFDKSKRKHSKDRPNVQWIILNSWWEFGYHLLNTLPRKYPKLHIEVVNEDGRDLRVW